MLLWVAWLVIFAFAVVRAGRWALNKWVLNTEVSPATLFIVGSGAYTVGSAAVCVWMAARGWDRIREDVTKRMDWRHWIVMVSVPILLTFVGYLLLLALSHVNASVLVPVLQAFVVVLTVGLSVAFLREKVSVLMGAGLAALVLGLCLTITDTHLRSRD